MRNNERGFSLMEVTVVLALVTAIMVVVYSMVEQTMRTAMFNETHNDLATMTQRGVNTLQIEIAQTKLFFEEDALGQGYRSALQLPADTNVWTDSLLPVIDPATAVLPDDASTRYTGNSLLIARQLSPLSILYDHDSNAGTPDVEFLADRYRFEYVYITRDTGRQFSQSGTALDLVMAKSTRIYADYVQLSSLGAQTGPVVQKLIDKGIDRAWDPSQAAGSAFYSMAGATDGTFNAALRNERIGTDRPKSILPGIFGGHVTGKIEYSVGFGSFPVRQPVFVYAQPDAARPTFPSGFEVKIAGPAGNRQVVTRVMVMAHYGTSKYESQQGFVTTAAR